MGRETALTSTVSAVYDSILLIETIKERCILLKRFADKRDSIS